MTLTGQELKELHKLYRQISLKNFEIERLQHEVIRFFHLKQIAYNTDITKAEQELQRGTRFINKSISHYEDFINRNKGDACNG